ncbi:MAG: 5-(carboxyamino)imidazole ribonucleotide synthase [Ignavibacteria bacterium]
MNFRLPETNHKYLKLKIGIIGGGQLARMIMEECYKFGFEFYILSKEKNSPAGQITNNELTGDWNDEECLKKFSEACDIITLENEFIDHSKIEFLERQGKPVYPDSRIIKLIQDKLYQKETLKKLNIPVSDFCKVDSTEEIIEFARKNNYPVMLKSRTMGYDGKGNFEIRTEKDIDEACKVLSGRGELMCERFVRFDKEIATQAVRSRSGEIKIYPVVETIQKDHICKYVIASQKQYKEIQEKVNNIAEKILTETNYTGVMGIEMFLTGNEILVNELAPRVHNSGHYTIEGSQTSQFENHVRAILDMPLGETSLKADNAVMINILGERDGIAQTNGFNEVLKNKNSYIHIYGKQETRKGRKMGHITVLSEDPDQAMSLANQNRENFFI